jgi:hypothetical protein
MLKFRGMVHLFEVLLPFLTSFLKFVSPFTPLRIYVIFSTLISELRQWQSVRVLHRGREAGPVLGGHRGEDGPRGRHLRKAAHVLRTAGNNSFYAFIVLQV